MRQSWSLASDGKSRIVSHVPNVSPASKLTIRCFPGAKNQDSECCTVPCAQKCFMSCASPVGHWNLQSCRKGKAEYASARNLTKYKAGELRSSGLLSRRPCWVCTQHGGRERIPQDSRITLPSGAISSRASRPAPEKSRLWRWGAPRRPNPRFSLWLPANRALPASQEESAQPAGS